MLVYAIEISLTRPAGHVELIAVARRSAARLTNTQDLNGFTVLVTADNQSRAIHKVWRRLGQVLPVDASWNVFPNADGHYTLIFPLRGDAAHRIAVQAASTGCTPENVLLDAISEALARDRTSLQAKLHSRLNVLLRDFTRDEIADVIKRRLSP